MADDAVLLVLAGNYQQAVDAARELPAGQRWRYVYEPRQLHGMRGCPFITVGTFWDRRDAGELYDLAIAAGRSAE